MVTVPDLLGLGRTTAEAKLDSLHLRYIARFPFSATGDGSATSQEPAAGTEVPSYSIVTVSYPSPMGPMEDSPVLGPPLNGNFEGQVGGVVVWRRGASINLVLTADGEKQNFLLPLYDDDDERPSPLLPRTVWMRRGAMLALAQCAFANKSKVRVTVADSVVLSIEIFRT